MDISTLEAEEWFWISRTQVEELAQKGWPFRNVTISQFYSLSDILAIKKNLQSIIRYVGSIIPAIGTVLTVCLIGALRRKTFTEKNSFFAAATIIAWLDLTFNILDAIVNGCYRGWKVTGFSNKEAMWTIATMRGMAYSASLASDLCALFLTLERCVAVTKPHFYRNLSTKSKKLLWSAVVVLTFLVGASRMHYTMAIQIEPAGDIYVYTSSPLATTPFVMGLVTFSDTAIPIILVITTPLLSTRLRLAILKRQKAKQAQQGAHQTIVPAGAAAVSHDGRVVKAVSVGHVLPENGWLSGVDVNLPQSQAGTSVAVIESQQIEKAQAKKSAIILTFALDVMTVTNSLAYCLYFVGETMMATHVISYESSYDQLLSYCQAQKFESYASLTLITVECLTRALNFPIYVALSVSMRKEFMIFVKSILKIA